MKKNKRQPKPVPFPGLAEYGQVLGQRRPVKIDGAPVLYFYEIPPPFLSAEAQAFGDCPQAFAVVQAHDQYHGLRIYAGNGEAWSVDPSGLHWLIKLLLHHAQEAEAPTLARYKQPTEPR